MFERLVTFNRGGTRQDVRIKDLETRLKELDSLIDGDVGRLTLRYTRALDSVDTAVNRLTEDEHSALRDIQAAQRADELEAESRKNVDIANSGVLPEAEQEVALSEAQNKIEAASVIRESIVNPDVTKTKNIQKVLAALGRVKAAALNLERNSKVKSLHRERLEILENLHTSKRYKDTLRVEVPTEGGLSGRNLGRFRSSLAERQRNIRGASVLRFTHNGKTYNTTIPFYEKESGELEPAFTNDPDVTAAALNLGYQIKVPKKYRRGSPELNPAIKIGTNGFVLSSVESSTLKEVKRAGDLSTFGQTRVYSPSALASERQQRYLAALPPVQPKYFSLLGTTPTGVDPSQVTRDDVYLSHAFDFIEGRSGEVRRRLNSTSQTDLQKEQERIANKYIPEIDEATSQLDALKERRSLRGKLEGDLVEEVNAAETALEEARQNLGQVEASVSRRISARNGVNTRRLNELEKLQLLADLAREEGDVQEVSDLEAQIMNAQEKLDAQEANQSAEFESLVAEVNEAKVAEKSAASTYRSLRKEQDAINEANELFLEESLQGKSTAEPQSDILEMDEAIALLQSKVDSLLRSQERALTNAYSAASATSNEDVSNARLPGDVAELNSIAEKVGADSGEAVQFVMHLYQMNLREFGLAASVLEVTQEGKDPVAYLERTLSPDILATLQQDFRGKNKRKLTNKQALRAYVDHLLKKIAPTPDAKGKRSNTAWFDAQTETSSPPTLRDLIAKVKKRYISARLDSPVFVDFNAPISEGPLTPGDVVSLEQAMSQDLTEDLSFSPALELEAGDLFDRVVNFITRDEAALNAARKIGSGLGLVSADLDSPRDLWSKVHDIVLRSPEVLAEMSPDTRSLLKPLYKAVIPSEVGSIKVMADTTVDKNIDAYTSLFRQNKIPATRITEGMKGLDVYRVFLRVAEQTSQPASVRAAAKSLTENFTPANMPTVNFVRDPAAALAPWVGVYSPSSQSITVNLTKTDNSVAGTLLRGALQHVVSVQRVADPSSDVTRGLESAVDELINTSPEAGTTFTEGVQFAMSLPQPTTKSKKVLEKVSNAVSGSDTLTQFLRDGKNMRGRSYQTVTNNPEPLTLEGMVRSALPKGVTLRMDESSDNPAWVSSSSPRTVYVNPKAMIDMLAGHPEEVQSRIVERIVGHEVAHLVSLETLTTQDRLDVYNAMTPAQRAEAVKRSPVASGKVVLAEEFLRMATEESLYGVDSDTEVHRLLSYGDGVRGTIMSYISRFMGALRTYLRNRSNSAIASHVERLSGIVESVQRDGFPEPAQSLDSQDALMSDMVSALENGSNQRYYSLPIVGSDSRTREWFEGIGRAFKIHKEVRDLVNSYRGSMAALEQESKEFTVELKLASKRLRKLGISAPTDDINLALGNPGATLSTSQRKVLSEARKTDVARKLSAEVVARNHEARVAAAEMTTIRSREVAQAAALASLKKLDPRLGNLVENFRASITSLSKKVGTVYDNGPISATIDRNGKVYLHRRYKFFLTEGWAASARAGKRVGKAPNLDWAGMRSDAIASIQEHARRSGKPITDAAARDTLNRFLNNLHKYKESSLGSVSQAAKETGMFKEKTDLPEAIQKLMGAIDSPVSNAVDTHMRLGKYLATDTMLRNLAPQLEAAGIVHREPIGPDGRDLVPILGDTRAKDPEYAAIHGLYATEEDARALRTELSISPARTSSGVGEDVMTAMVKKISLVAGVSMTLKTLGSVGFYTRNMMSNFFFFLPMQGIWTSQFTRGKEAASLATQASLRGTAIESLNNRLFSFVGTDPANSARVRRLIELGVLQSDVRAEIIRDVYQLGEEGNESQLADVSNWVDGKEPATWIKKAVGAAKKSPKATPELLAKVNNAIDGSAKVVMFEHELDVLKKVRDEINSGKTDEQLEKEAATKVLRTLPGHARVNPIITNFTRSGVGLLAAPFARFKSETVRTYIESYKVAAEEIAEGRRIGSRTLVNRGIRRFIGIGTTTAVMGQVVATIYGTLFSLLAGLTEGEDEDKGSGFTQYNKLSGAARTALRGALPDWQKNSTLFVRADGDEISVMDMTYINPFSLVTDPFTNFKDRAGTEGFSEGAEAFLGGFIHDFVGEGIAFGAAREVFTNSDDRRSKIYQKTDSLPTVVEKSLTHYWEQAMKPGILSKGGQIVDALGGNTEDEDRTFNALEIAVGELFGARPQRRKLTELHLRSVKSQKRTLDEVSRELWPLTSKGRQDKDSIEKAVDDYVAAYTKVMNSHRLIQRGWEEINPELFTKESYVRAMIKADHSKSKAHQVIFGGVADRPIRGRVALDNMFEAAESEDGEGGALRLLNYQNAILKYPRFIPLK